MKAIEIENLRKTYKNGLEALRGISLSVEEGDFFALLGANGAGKSTAIGIISSLVNKTEGRIRIFGNDIDREPGKAKSMIGLVPQEFNFNIFEPCQEVIVNQAGYYGIPRKEAFQRAEYYLRKLDLWEKRRESARTLSGGMKRRLMIARALVHQPKLLILDEPTAGVDIEIRRSMWEFMQEINKSGTTIILTTHYLEEAESLCRNIAIIDEGRIVRDTDMKSLLQNLHCETLVLNTRQPLPNDFRLDGYQCRLLDEYTLEVDVFEEAGINGLFSELAKGHVKVSSMRNKSNRLEQLFLSLVGSNGKKSS